MNLLSQNLLPFFFSEELLGPLDEIVAYLPKVQVLRNTKREGLMRTRMRGVMVATAPVIVIKDAHTEYLPGKTDEKHNLPRILVINTYL